jgi:D-3-phosphoglycerate dehydrogenase / 2-oxoglutarate reductase
MSMPTVTAASDCDDVCKLGQYGSVPSTAPNTPASVDVDSQAAPRGQQTGVPTLLATAPLRGPGLDQLRSLAAVIHEPWIDQDPLRIYDAPGLAARAEHEHAQILVVESDLVSGPVFELPLLAVAATRGDPNNVDLAAATAAGIPVLHTPGRNADAVAELTLALLLAVTRQITQADTDAHTGQVFRDGTIPYQRFRAWELAGRTVGLVGLGAVGRALRWRLEGLGMTVLATDPYADDAHETEDEVLERSDVISLHAAVTPETHGLWDEKHFAAMKPGAVFLNTARAKLHDTDALVAALASGQISGAGLDHVEGEQLPDGHPLLGFSNVVLTPHIAGATYDTEARGTQMIADDLGRLLAGETPLHLANPEVLHK